MKFFSAALSGLCLITASAKPQPEPQKLDSDLMEIERLVSVLEMVHTQHIDAERTNYARLVNFALEGALSSLDRFSAFYHPETYQALQADETLELSVPGLGLELGKNESHFYILSVTKHGAADQAGVSAGDRLTRINEKPLADLDLPQALGHLRGRPGEMVSLSLSSKLSKEPYDVTLTRRLVRQSPLSKSRMIDGTNIGLIRLAEFSATADTQFAAALDDLEARGMKKLIFDLRGNPGGQLDVAVKILGEFVPPNTEVVTTRSRNAKQANLNSSLKTPGRKRRPRDYPVAVLIDRNSASAAELVPGCLQDLGRATIFGETSFGKGSVQTISPLGNGSALRLTIATYHTPSGKTPHKVGVTPDRFITITDKDRSLLRLSFASSTTTPEQRATLHSWSDPVVSAAVAHLK